MKKILIGVLLSSAFHAVHSFRLGASFITHGRATKSDRFRSSVKLSGELSDRVNNIQESKLNIISRFLVVLSTVTSFNLATANLHPALAYYDEDLAKQLVTKLSERSQAASSQSSQSAVTLSESFVERSNNQNPLTFPDSNAIIEPPSFPPQLLEDSEKIDVNVQSSSSYLETLREILADLPGQLSSLQSSSGPSGLEALLSNLNKIEDLISRVISTQTASSRTAVTDLLSNLNKVGNDRTITALPPLFTLSESDIANLRLFLRDFISDWKVLLGISALFLANDNYEKMKAVRNLNADQLDSIKEYSDKVNDLEKKTKFQENLIASLENMTMEAKKEIEKLSRQLVEKLDQIEEMRESIAKLADLDQQIFSDAFTNQQKLENEVLQLQNEYNQKYVTLFRSLDRINKKNQENTELIQVIRQREEAILEAIKAFLVDNKVIGPGIANMLVARTLPGVLKELKLPPPSKELDAVISVLNLNISTLNGVIHSYKEKVNDLSFQIQCLTSELSGTRNHLNQTLVSNAFLKEQVHNLTVDLTQRNDVLAKAVIQKENLETRLRELEGVAKKSEDLIRESDKALSKLNSGLEKAVGYILENMLSRPAATASAPPAHAPVSSPESVLTLSERLLKYLREVDAKYKDETAVYADTVKNLKSIISSNEIELEKLAVLTQEKEALRVQYEDRLIRMEGEVQGRLEMAEERLKQDHRVQVDAIAAERDEFKLKYESLLIELAAAKEESHQLRKTVADLDSKVQVSDDKFKTTLSTIEKLLSVTSPSTELQSYINDLSEENRSLKFKLLNSEDQLWDIRQERDLGAGLGTYDLDALSVSGAVDAEQGGSGRNAGGAKFAEKDKKAGAAGGSLKGAL